MLEFVIVYLLARHNGHIVQAKGVSPTKYQWGTVGLWFSLELAGFLVGGAVLGPRASLLALYPFGIVGAIAGAVLSSVWANDVAPASYMPIASNFSWRPTHVVPASGLTGWAAPDASQTPTAAIPPGTQLVLSERQGDWAKVRAFNGWAGWVDARQLELIPLSQR